MLSLPSVPSFSLRFFGSDQLPSLFLKLIINWQGNGVPALNLE